MDRFVSSVVDIYKWAKKDYHEYPLRFILEILAWFASISCSVILAVTVPTPPWLVLYPTFIAQCAIFGWAAWSRGSVGMVSNYLLLVAIDSVALFRLISN